ncbi:MAG: hypothetical protein ACRDJT_10670 [Actinomycetota bacterium]
MTRNAVRLAYSLFSVCALLIAVSGALQIASLSSEVPQEWGSREADIVQLISLLPFLLVGVLIAARRPSNSIGWLILAGITVVAFDSLVGEYALRGLVIEPGSLPAADIAAWIYQWIWFIPIALLSVLFLVFAGGKTQGRAGRWILAPNWLALFVMAGPISRTLAYGALTTILAGGYLLVVLALRSVLPVDDDSPFIVAASTLGVVAAFGPLRARVQHAVDRRFNRAHFDAELTVAEFGNRLRAEVELSSLADGLLGVVHTTMQPTHLFLWLRPTGDHR